MQPCAAPRQCSTSPSCVTYAACPSLSGMLSDCTIAWLNYTPLRSKGMSQRRCLAKPASDMAFVIVVLSPIPGGCSARNSSRRTACDGAFGPLRDYELVLPALALRQAGPHCEVVEHDGSCHRDVERGGARSVLGDVDEPIAQLQLLCRQAGALCQQIRQAVPVSGLPPEFGAPGCRSLRRASTSVIMICSPRTWRLPRSKQRAALPSGLVAAIAASGIADYGTELAALDPTVRHILRKQNIIDDVLRR